MPQSLELIGEAVRRWVLGVLFALVVACSAIAVFYAVLNRLYGTPKIEVIWRGIAPMDWENAEKSEPTVLTWQITDDIGKAFEVENVAWFVNARPLSWSAVKGSENVILTCEKNYRTYPDNLYRFNYIIPLDWENAEQLKPPVLTVSAGAGISYDVTGEGDTRLDRYLDALPGIASTPSEGITEDRGALNVSTFVRETESIPVLPISASIGVTMGLMVFAVWIGYKRMWGDAASTLLEQGLHDMTVRDVEIVGQIIDLKEFTIPELVRRTRVSKITAWRTVQKLIEQGLVKPTEKTRLAANGLGGRGKPSRIYRYVGARASESSTER